jgi:hypothetical protein
VASCNPTGVSPLIEIFPISVSRQLSAFVLDLFDEETLCSPRLSLEDELLCVLLVFFFFGSFVTTGANPGMPLGLDLLALVSNALTSSGG